MFGGYFCKWKDYFCNSDTFQETSLKQSIFVDRQVSLKNKLTGNFDRWAFRRARLHVFCKIQHNFLHDWKLTFDFFVSATSEWARAILFLKTPDGPFCLFHFPLLTFRLLLSDHFLPFRSSKPELMRREVQRYVLLRRASPLHPTYNKWMINCIKVHKNRTKKTYTQIDKQTFLRFEIEMF